MREKRKQEKQTKRQMERSRMKKEEMRQKATERERGLCSEWNSTTHCFLKSM